MTIQIRTTSVNEVLTSEAWPELHDEYAAECANPALSIGYPDERRYAALETQGLLHTIGVYDNGVLVGFSAFILTPVLHFSCSVAVCESIFLRKAWRKGSAGMSLVKAVAQKAKDVGAPGVYFSAPVGSTFDRYCRAIGFIPTNNVYFEALK